jgi:hypothetical protein
MLAPADSCGENPQDCQLVRETVTYADKRKPTSATDERDTSAQYGGDLVGYAKAWNGVRDSHPLTAFENGPSELTTSNSTIAVHPPGDLNLQLNQTPASIHAN